MQQDFATQLKYYLGLLAPMQNLQYKTDQPTAFEPLPKASPDVQHDLPYLSAVEHGYATAPDQLRQIMGLLGYKLLAQGELPDSSVVGQTQYWQPRQVTIAEPQSWNRPDVPSTVVHEMGHVLDDISWLPLHFRTEFANPFAEERKKAVDSYAQESSSEGFAELFSTDVMRGHGEPLTPIQKKYVEEYPKTLKGMHQLAPEQIRQFLKDLQDLPPDYR